MQPVNFISPRHVGHSLTRSQTCVPCFGRQILNRWISREVPERFFFFFASPLRIQLVPFSFSYFSFSLLPFLSLLSPSLSCSPHSSSSSFGDSVPGWELSWRCHCFWLVRNRDSSLSPNKIRLILEPDGCLNPPRVGLSHSQEVQLLLKSGQSLSQLSHRGSPKDTGVGSRRWLRQRRICLQRRRPGFSSWGGKIPWRRKWQPTPVLSPGKSYSPW